MYAIARAALKQFPTNSMIYTMLVALAQRSEPERQKELATEILNAPGAPPGAKVLAGHLLKGTRPYQVDKRGNLRDTEIRFGLEHGIKSLLDEQESPAPK